MTVDTVIGLLDSGTRTLVCCGAGLSRSPTVAAAALALHRGEPIEQIIGRIGRVKRLDISGPFWADVVAMLGENR